MLLADEARFRAKQGLFQSIGLYSIFGKKLVEHLWLLWELVLTGGPTLVLGSSVGASSSAILGMVRSHGFCPYFLSWPCRVAVVYAASASATIVGMV